MRLKRICTLLAALSVTTGAVGENYRWDAVAMGGGGLVSGLVTSKTERNVVFARTDVGGAYRWDAQAGRWQPMTDWIAESELGLLGVESLAVDPRNAANVYMLAGTSYFNNGKTAILRSSDYGKTFSTVDVSAQFKAHGNGMGRQTGEKLQVDPGDSNVLYAGTRRNGLFRSTDAGKTWGKVAGFDVTSTPNDNGISFVLLDPASSEGGRAQRMFVGVSRLGSAGPNLYFSYDGGDSFIPVEGGPSGLMPHRAVMSPEGMLYITYANGAGPHPANGEAMDQGQVWEYDAVGGNWTNITPAGMTRPFGGISMDPADPKRLVLSTINNWYLQHGSAYGDRIFTSRNAGRSWQDVIARGFAMDTKGANWIGAQSIHWAGAVEFDPFDSRSVWVTSGNGLFKTADIDAPTATWAFDVAGLEETVPLNLVSVPGGPLVSTIGDYDGFIQNDPAQYGAQHAPGMGSTSGLAVASLDSRYMARAGSSLYYSANGGASWTKTATSKGSSGQLALSADGQVLLHSPSGSNSTWRSTDFGTSWSAATGLSVTNARPLADPVNPLKFYVYDNVNGRMLVSTDGGASFNPAGVVAAGGAPLIRAVHGSEGHLWACLANGLVYSTDSGASFTRVGNVSACAAVGLGKAAPAANYATLYMWGTVGGKRGLLRSTDKGLTWVRVNDDAHEYGGPGNGQFVAGDMNTFGTVYMGTVGRGIVYGAVDAGGDVTVTAVDSSVPQAPPPSVNKCAYVVTASWSGGYNAAIRITNNRATAINGWTVNWTYSDNSKVQSFWNAAVTGTAPNYTGTNNQSWNRVINPGSTVEFGITVSGSALPVVTGDVCQ
jgi:xyloglucan-specific exo-beta-1,4-glucanase